MDRAGDGIPRLCPEGEVFSQLVHEVAPSPTCSSLAQEGDSRFNAGVECTGNLCANSSVPKRGVLRGGPCG